MIKSESSAACGKSSLAILPQFANQYIFTLGNELIDDHGLGLQLLNTVADIGHGSNSAFTSVNNNVINSMATNVITNCDDITDCLQLADSTMKDENSAAPVFYSLTDTQCVPYHRTSSSSSGNEEMRTDRLSSDGGSVASSPSFYDKIDHGDDRKICLVCCDVASGFHYGIASCEACKAFFKRTVQGNIEYSCPSSGRCEINKRRRKACQACRFQKCIQKGMLREGVRLDRVRGGRQKYRRLSSFGQLDRKRFLLESSTHALESLMEIEPDIDPVVPDLDSTPNELKCMKLICDCTDHDLVLTIGWARQITAFSELDLSDQMILLQNCWLEILCLNMAYRSRPYKDVLVFSPNAAVNKYVSGFYELPKKLEVVLKKLSEKLTRLDITKEEYVLLKGIILFNSDCELSNSTQIQDLREQYMTALEDWTRNCDLKSCRMANILTSLQLLVKAKLLAKEYWLNVKQDGRIQMHKLFLEMLETD